MNKYFNQLKNNFDDWGRIFPVSTLLTQETSPFKKLLERGFSAKNSRIVFSVCSDDINRLVDRDTIENKLIKQFGAEFHLGNLAGYPIGGITGINAASHHAPNCMEGGSRTPGNLIFYISPHLGLDIEAEIRYGYVQRPGQVKLTSSCGAMMGFLRAIRHADTISDLQKKIKEEPNDLAKSFLFRELIKNYGKEIIEDLHSQDINQNIMKLAKINYDLIMTKFKLMMKTFLDKYGFKGDFGIIGGITINTQKEDYFIFRDYYLNSL
ncbi:MAG: hypothetical protein ACTSR8_07355 [Promethearchaeota archaeon]